MTILTGDNITYTSQQIFEADGGVIERTTLTTNSIDITPDAVDIISKFKGSSNLNASGKVIEFYIYNNSSYEISLISGIGITMKPGPTDTIQPSTIKRYTIVITSNTTANIFNLDWNGTKLVTTELVTNVITTTSNSVKTNGSMTVYGNIFGFSSVDIITATENVQYSTGQILGGLLKRNCNGSSREDTLPNAVDIIAAIPDATIGSSFMTRIQNVTPNNKNLTIIGGTNTIISGDDARIERNCTMAMLFVVGNITPSEESITAYILGIWTSAVGGDVSNITIVTSNAYTILDSDNSIHVDTNAIHQKSTLTLPLISTIGPKRYFITDSTGKAGSYNIQINTSGSDLIEGSGSIIINSNYSSISMYNDENGRWIIY